MKRKEKKRKKKKNSIRSRSTNQLDRTTSLKNDGKGGRCLTLAMLAGNNRRGARLLNNMVVRVRARGSSRLSRVGNLVGALALAIGMIAASLRLTGSVDKVANARLARDLGGTADDLLRLAGRDSAGFSTGSLGLRVHVRAGGLALARAAAVGDARSGRSPVSFAVLIRAKDDAIALFRVVVREGAVGAASSLGDLDLVEALLLGLSATRGAVARQPAAPASLAVCTGEGSREKGNKGNNKHDSVHLLRERRDVR